MIIIQGPRTTRQPPYNFAKLNWLVKFIGGKNSTYFKGSWSFILWHFRLQISHERLTVEHKPFSVLSRRSCLSVKIYKYHLISKWKHPLAIKQHWNYEISPHYDRFLPKIRRQNNLETKAMRVKRVEFAKLRRPLKIILINQNIKGSTAEEQTKEISLE